MFSSKNKRQRHYKVSKTSIKDELIDKQILAIHRAMVSKVIQQPEYISQIKERLISKREQGEIGYSEYITWLSIMELYDDVDTFRQGVLDNSKQMKRLRRKTPFVGILTEEERQQALNDDAAGYIDSVGFML